MPGSEPINGGEMAAAAGVSSPVCILVLGMAGSGKTALVQVISRSFSLPGEMGSPMLCSPRFCGVGLGGGGGLSVYGSVSQNSRVLR